MKISKAAILTVAVLVVAVLVVAASKNGKTPAAATKANAVEPPDTAYQRKAIEAHIKDAAKARKLADFVKWAMADGEKEAAGLGYAPLPGDLAARLSARVDSVATSASSGAK